MAYRSGYRHSPAEQPTSISVTGPSIAAIAGRIVPVRAASFVWVPPCRPDDRNNGLVPVRLDERAESPRGIGHRCAEDSSGGEDQVRLALQWRQLVEEVEHRRAVSDGEGEPLVRRRRACRFHFGERERTDHACPLADDPSRRRWLAGQRPTVAAMAEFVLVDGAWSGAHGFHLVRRQLWAAGHGSLHTKPDRHR